MGEVSEVFQGQTLVRSGGLAPSPAFIVPTNGVGARCADPVGAGGKGASEGCGCQSKIQTRDMDCGEDDVRGTVAHAPTRICDREQVIAWMEA